MPSYAGAVVYRDDTPTPRILVVSARRRSHLWIFPKGRVERGERMGQCALRETYEESGVRGNVVSELGKTVTQRAGGTKLRVRYYLVKRTSESPSPEKRQKRWLSPAKAFAALPNAKSRKLLVRALRELEAQTGVAPGTYLATLQTSTARRSLARDLWREIRFLVQSIEDSVTRLRNR